MKASVRWLTGIAAATALVGCGPTTQSQLTRCQNEKKTLLTRIVDEQKRVEALTAQTEQLETRLADSERQLARLYTQSSGRYAAADAIGAGPNRSTYPGAPLPSAPPTGPVDRPARLIPLGSPSNSNFGPSLAPPLSDLPSRELPSRGRVDSGASSSGGAGGMTNSLPSLAAPANGRTESGWVPKAGGATRNTAGGPATLDNSRLAPSSPRR